MQNQTQAETIRRVIVEWLIQNRTMIISSGIIYDLLRGIGIKQNTEQIVDRIQEIVPELKMVEERRVGTDEAGYVIRTYIFVWQDVDEVTLKAIQLVAKSLNTIYDSDVRKEVIAGVIYHAVGSSDYIDYSYLYWYINKLREIYNIE